MNFRQFRFILFVLSGGIAASANILSRVAFSWFVPYWASIILAFFVGLTTAFALMRVLVFEESKLANHTQFLRFGLVNLLALVQVWLVSLGLAYVVFPAINYSWQQELTAHVIGVLSTIFSSYFLHKNFSFKAN